MSSILTQGRGDVFVWIRCSGITFFSVYLPPNETMPDFQRRLDAFEDAILGTDGQILVGGDFTASALEWRMPHSDSRGKRIVEMMGVVINTGSAPTFRCPGCDGSIPDVTFSSESLMTPGEGSEGIETWQTFYVLVDGGNRRAPEGVSNVTMHRELSTFLHKRIGTGSPLYEKQSVELAQANG